uniref:Uncharacterized protein n=1 Tax=Candidozyma auris TaxID=498019 RepID=A0A0L0P3C2_CANAR
MQATPKKPCNATKINEEFFLFYLLFIVVPMALKSYFFIHVIMLID